MYEYADLAAIIPHPPAIRAPEDAHPPVPPAMIAITLDTDSRGTDRAQCFVGGRFFAAQSRSGAIHALCRVLRAAGIPDQPWEVPGRIKGSSIYWMADRYVADGDSGTRTARFKAPPSQRPKAQKGGAKPQGAIRVGNEPQDAVA